MLKSLRSLAVDIMFNTGAGKLLEVDSAVDAVKSNAMEAAGNMDALNESTEQAGKTSNKTKDEIFGMSKQFLAITGAGVALGGALMKTTRRAEELNAGLRRIEVQTGESEAELRKMLMTLMDETWNPKQTVASMEELIKVGITTKDEFEKILPVFDDFAGATGKGMTEGIHDLNAVLSALDIPMIEAGEHIDTLTWLTTGTTVAMGDLGRTMRREQSRIRDMGLSFDEIAVAMATLEAEGIKGPRAIMRFQSAIQDAEGDVQAFWEGLGVSADVLGEQNKLLLESEGLTSALSDANNQSLGMWDKLKHKLDMAMWSAGTFLEPVKDLGPALMALGPITKVTNKGLNLFGKGLKMARVTLIPTIATTWAWTAALLANPVTWIVIGIVALIGALILLWKNWDSVIGWIDKAWGSFIGGIVFGFEWIMDLFGGMPVWMQVAIAAFMPFIGIPLLIITHWDKITEFFTGLGSAAYDWGKDMISGLIGGIKDMWGKAKDTVSDFASGVADKFKSFFGISSPSKLMMEYGGDITQGLQIGMDDDIPEIPVPEFPDFPTPRDFPTPEDAPSNNSITATFSPNVEIHIHGNADGQNIKKEVEKLFPGLVEDFFEMLQLRMGLE